MIVKQLDGTKKPAYPASLLMKHENAITARVKAVIAAAKKAD